MKKSDYKNYDSIGVYSFGFDDGIIVKSFEYGIDDYIIFDYKGKMHKSKLYSNTKNIFFRFGTYRINLSDIIRI